MDNREVLRQSLFTRFFVLPFSRAVYVADGDHSPTHLSIEIPLSILIKIKYIPKHSTLYIRSNRLIYLYKYLLAHIAPLKGLHEVCRAKNPLFSIIVLI